MYALNRYMGADFKKGGIGDDGERSCDAGGGRA